MGTVDVVIDRIGEPVWTALGEFLRPGGRLVSYGRTAGSIVPLDIGKFFHAQWTFLGTANGSPGEFNAMIDHLDAADWRPVIDSEYTLDEISQAHVRQKAGPVREGRCRNCLARVTTSASAAKDDRTRAGFDDGDAVSAWNRGALPGDLARETIVVPVEVLVRKVECAVHERSQNRPPRVLRSPSIRRPTFTAAPLGSVRRWRWS